MAKETLRGESVPEGLAYATWTPGDGATRYRFFEAAPGELVDYHQGHEVYTALGAKEAHVFMSGWRRCKQSMHSRSR
jgi:hypothetical protein